MITADTNVGQTYRLVQGFKLLQQSCQPCRSRCDGVDQELGRRSCARQWLEKPIGVAPIAMMPEAIAAELRAQNRIVWFSRDTLEKRRVAHRN